MTAAEALDLVVIGGGTGGYTAAIRASQLGLRTAVVESSKLGGTCLHLGCIPTKALLESSGLYHKISRQGGELGIQVKEASIDPERIAARRDRIVGQLHRGVEGLMRKHRVKVVQGQGRLIDRNTVDAGGHKLEAKDIIVATGSAPRSLTGLDIDGTQIVNSDHATLARDLPASICIVGAGAVGVEFATYYHQMGVHVTLVEALDRLVPLEDAEVSKELLKQFQAAGIDCRLGARIDGAKATSDRVVLRLAEGEVNAERVLVAVGREPRSRGLGLEEVGVEIGEKGQVKVDEWMRTSVPGVHAIGDLVGGFLLAHAAAHEGVVAAEDIAGKRQLPMEQELVTRCTFSHPEIASVGLTEAEARQRGEVKVGRFPLTANGRALIHGEPAGFVKLVSDGGGQLLGAHIIGIQATELISAPALARLFQGDTWEISRNIHPHPTLSEAIGEAALDTDGMALNF